MLIVCFVTLISAQSAHAAYLFLDPSAKENIALDETFSISLRINTEGEKVQAAEAWLDFDTTQLEFIDAKDPASSEKFFSNTIVTKNSAVLIYIANWITPGTDAISSTTGKDSIATLRFKAIKAGSFEVFIRCKQGDTRDSAVAARKNKKTEDIIDCTKVKGGTYVVAGTVGTTPQPTRPGGSTPTSSQPRASATPVPTVRPGDPTVSPTPVPSATLSPAVSPTRTPTAATGGAALTLTPTQTASPSALPATGITGTIGVVVGVGLLLTAVSIFVKIFVL